MMTTNQTINEPGLAVTESNQEENNLGLSPTMAALKRARSHWGLKIGLGILLVMAIFALFAPWLAPHDPYMQNL
ncbi:MAG: ABC transporter permease, partial [Pseudomonadota bacterium]